MKKTADTVGHRDRRRLRPIRAAAPASTPSTAAAAERYRANLEKAC
jgi:hypothetical protein